MVVLVAVLVLLTCASCRAHTDAVPGCENVAAAADIQQAISVHDHEVAVCIDSSRCDVAFVPLEAFLKFG